MRILKLLAAGSLWFVCAGQLLADSAEEWLIRMDHAVASISYRGTLVSTGSNRIDTMRVLHRVDKDGVRERIYALDGPPREVVRNGDQVRCLISGQRSVIVDNPFPTRLLPRIPLDEILGPDSVYRVQMEGTGRVAARKARIMLILPLDEFRYGRRLWLDSDTGMLLRSVVFGPDGTIVEKLSFVEIELGALITDSELEGELENPSHVTRYQIGNQQRHGEFSSSKTPLWLPESLPKGFRLTSVGHGGGNGQRYEHLLFSDGLASFSIYVEFDHTATIAEQVESRGAMHVYTGSIDGNMVTVVGEVPAPTVRLIGRHLRRLQRPPRLHNLD